MKQNANRIIFGVGPVREALQAEGLGVERIVVRKGGEAKFRDLSQAARDRGITFEVMEKEAFSKLVGERGTHQGIAALLPPFAYADYEDLLEALAPGKPLVFLDCLTDPHNVGAIVRTAYLLGAAGVVLPTDRSVEINGTVSKVSAGATEHLPICQVTNLVRAMKQAKEAGAWIAGLSEHGKDGTRQLTSDVPWVLVAGNEGKGLRQQVKKACDVLVALPMANEGVGSFNVSVATALGLYEIVRTSLAKGS